MWGPPATKAEFFRRSVIVPPIVGLAAFVLASLVTIFFLFVKSPPEDRAKKTEQDRRLMYASITGVFGIGMLGWGFIKASRWRILRSRGQLTFVDLIDASPIVKNDARPVRITYRVNGVEYVIARDLHTSSVDRLLNDAPGARVLYDPKRPNRAEVLDSQFVSLPDK